jgi:hypothetical protein
MPGGCLAESLATHVLKKQGRGDVEANRCRYAPSIFTVADDGKNFYHNNSCKVSIAAGLDKRNGRCLPAGWSLLALSRRRGFEGAERSCSAVGEGRRLGR